MTILISIRWWHVQFWGVRAGDGQHGGNLRAVGWGWRRGTETSIQGTICTSWISINNLSFIVNISPLSTSTSQFLYHCFTYPANGLCNVKMIIKLSYLHRLYVVKHYGVGDVSKIRDKKFHLDDDRILTNIPLHCSMTNCVLYKHDNWFTII